MSKKKFKKEKEKRDNKERGSMYTSLMAMLEENPAREFKVQSLVKKLGLKKKAMIEELFKLLDQLEESGEIKQTEEGNFKVGKTAGKSSSASKSKVLSGVVDHVNARFAYIATGEEGAKDVYVKTSDLNTALHGDNVNITLFAKKNWC